MEVRVYATLRLKIGQAKIDVGAGPGDTVRDAIREVLKRYPALAPDVLTDDCELVEHVHVFLNGRNVRLLDGLDSVIQEGQRLDIFPPVGGGQHMEIHERIQNDILIIHINRQIDSTTAPVLGERLEAVIGDGHTHLILDVSDVSYISSAGLRVLSVALKTVRTPEVGGDMYLANPSKTVAYAFKISGFDQLFCIYDTVAEAIDAMVASRQMDWVD